MLGRTDSRIRLIALLCVLVLAAGALGLRLAYWQIGQADDLRRIAAEQLTQPSVAQVQRGEIVDRRGTILATTAYRDTLAAYPDLIADADRTSVAKNLAAILGLPDGQKADLIAKFESGVPYVVVARRITQEQSDAVRAGLASGDLSALDLQPQPSRFYPNAGGSPGTTLASQLLGFVTEDGQGSYGVEQYGQQALAGDSGATADVAPDIGLPHVGGRVQLTIDASLQLRLEKELYAAWVADRAPRVSGIVMDPYTGAILAWASVPGYDENNYSAVADSAPELFTDPIVSQVYEPGSVMKMFTAAAALEKGVVTLNTPIADAKALKIGPDVVHNGDHGSIGTVPFQDIIARSRNVGVGKVALELGHTTDDGAWILYNMWQRLGIGRPTGVEIGTESAGIVADPSVDPWQAIDLVNRAFGQGVAVTPIQLATAFSAMVNGGRLPVPHLISELGDQPQTVTEPQQVIDPQLSDTLRQLMIHVVDAGPNYAAETKIDGYVVGGKTGTAQIWDARAGDWMPDTYNHTFVGFVGAEKPEAVILVRIHDTVPHVKVSWGMTLEMTSNALFRRVALDAITALDIQPLPGSGSPVAPDTNVSSTPADMPARSGLPPPPAGSGRAAAHGL